MFVMPIHDPAKPLAQCIDDDIELAVQCEELGFDDFWVGEHHSSSVENIVMPEIFPSISRASAGFSKAAERGFRFISHHMIRWSALQEQWKTYRSAAAAAGRIADPGDWAVARNAFVADSTDLARRLAKSNSLGA